MVSGSSPDWGAILRQAFGKLEIFETSGLAHDNMSWYDNIHKYTPTIVACFGILAIIISLWKIFFPTIRIKIISVYATWDKDRRGIFILKLQATSNVDLVLEDVIVSITLENRKTFKMIPFSVRQKAVLFKMLDLKNEECDYKLLKPLEPDFRNCGIKQGNNEYYISLKSVEPFEDHPIQAWLLKLKWRQHILPVPDIPWFNKKTVTVSQPEGKDLYFDDSLFQKISSEERDKLINEL